MMHKIDLQPITKNTLSLISWKIDVASYLMIKVHVIKPFLHTAKRKENKRDERMISVQGSFMTEVYQSNGYWDKIIWDFALWT